MACCGSPDVPVVVLASSSPRRSELLTRLGLRPVLAGADVDETPAVGESAVELVERLARTKLSAGWDRFRCSGSAGHDRAHHEAGGLTIAADTVVAVGGRVLGKPEGKSDAVAMLNTLSGRTHEVTTGLAVGRAPVLDGPLVDVATTVETTQVRIRPLDDELIRWYVDSGEPLDKAGAYGIQGVGCLLADDLDGSYLNVVGLPVVALDGLCRGLGWPLHRLAGAPPSIADATPRGRSA